ncbi:MAG: nucleoid-associated protein [Defluviitaleaceae bacterium]|nr:nucleoid-associated protein [Defluviitaleaceae bacterium]
MEIKNAILHILKNDGNPSVYSESELDIDSEICEAFISKHAKKLMNNPAVREATFRSNSVVYQAIQEHLKREISFKDLSLTLATRLSEIINKHVDIPPSDVMVVRFNKKQDQYLAIFKLNYNECFSRESAGNANNLIKCTALPFGNGKVEEACLIPLDVMLVNLIEKAHPVDGEMINYFSEMFLEAETALSRKEQAQIINEVADEFVDEYFDSDIRTRALVKTAMTEEAEESEGVVSMDNVAARVFEDQNMKQDFVHTLREAGIVEDMELGEKFVKQQFGTQRLKAENGIEIKFPAELAVDEEEMEIEKHSDGSVTVTLKRLRIQV